MPATDVSDVRGFILEHLAVPLRASGIDASVIDDQFDLRARGVIDSIGFVQMVTALETQFGRPVDLLEMEPANLTRVGPLSRHVAAQLRVNAG